MNNISFLNKYKSKLISLTWIFIICFVLFYVVYIYILGVSFPFQDDIMLIDFINNAVINPNTNFSILINELFRVDNDHLMLTPRLVTLIDFLLTKNIHFKAYIMLACLLTIAILFFFYKEFKQLNNNIYYFLPVIFFFLQPQYYEISCGALTGLQYTFLIVIMFSSLNCIRENRLWLGIFLAIMATFTHGNGFFVFIILGFYLLFNKNYKGVFIVIIGFLFSIIIYYHFYRVGNDTKVLRNLSNFIISIFGLLGGINMGMIENDLLISVVLGIFIMLVFSYFFLRIVFYTEQSKKNIFMVAVLLFSILTITLISFARSWSGFMIGSRYQFYSSLVIICIYLLILSEISFKLKKIFFALALGYSIYFSGHTYWKYTRFNHYNKTQQLSDCYNLHTNKIMFRVDTGFVKLAKPIFEKAQNLKSWEAKSDISKIEILKNIKTAENLNVNVIIKKKEFQKSETRRGATHTFFSENFPLGNTIFEHYFLVLHDPKSFNVYLSALEGFPNKKILFLKTGNFFREGSSTDFKSELMQKGIYDIYFMNNKSKKMYKINEKYPVF